MIATLRSKVTDALRGVYFFGTAPPRLSVDEQAMDEIADRLLDRLSQLEYDGLIVYDIQDETCRTPVPRPFPYAPTKDSRTYSSLLRKKSGRSIITYRCISQCTPEAFSQWLDESWNEFEVDNLVLVGSPSRMAKVKLSLHDAYAILKAKNYRFSLGGVTIAERHARKGNEHLRLIYKAENGCDFFVSQAVYNADLTIRLLTQYAQACADKGEKPKRIILTFAPCGSEKTLNFIQWLGISMHSDIQSRILNSHSPLSESIKICRSNLAKILDHCLPLGIPFGLNIENLTNRKEEVDASIQLFTLLKITLEERLSRNDYFLNNHKVSPGSVDL